MCHRVRPAQLRITDQADRMSKLAKTLDVLVTPWHSDVPASAKNRVLKDPRGIVIISHMTNNFVQHGFARSSVRWFQPSPSLASIAFGLALLSFGVPRSTSRLRCSPLTLLA